MDKNTQHRAGSDEQIFTCSCGFSWKKGKSGSHECGPYYREQIAKLTAALSQAQAQSAESVLVPKGFGILPIDLKTHLHDFDAACRIAKEHAKVEAPDIDDKTYWQRQIDVIAKIRTQIDAAPSAPVETKEAVQMPDLMPVILWLENGCDPKWAAKELRIYQSRVAAPSPSENKGEGNV